MMVGHSCLSISAPLSSRGVSAFRVAPQSMLTWETMSAQNASSLDVSHVSPLISPESTSGTGRPYAIAKNA